MNHEVPADRGTARDRRTPRVIRLKSVEQTTAIGSRVFTLRSMAAQNRLAAITRRYEGVAGYKRVDGTVRHKCFISYHSADSVDVLAFVNTFEDVFIPRAIGLDDDDPLIDSENSDYIVNAIRDRYLRDSTVTMVVVGQCTWSRRFVDAEIYSSLRAGTINRINGLMAIELRSVAGHGVLPARVSDNYVKRGASYTKYWAYPGTSSGLSTYIQQAFDARQGLRHLINNTRPRRKRSTRCP